MTQQFEPFQKVLVRDCEDKAWRANFFSHLEHYDNNLTLFVCAGHKWHQCISYEGNEHLLGTTDSTTPPEPDFKFGDKVEVSDHKVNWYRAIFYEMEQLPCNRPYIVVRNGIGADAWKYCRKADW